MTKQQAIEIAEDLIGTAEAFPDVELSTPREAFDDNETGEWWVKAWVLIDPKLVPKSPSERSV